MNKYICILLALVQLSVYAYHVKVFNNTPFPIEARCEKVGALKTHWEDIDPSESKKVGCRGADCPDGVTIKIKGKESGWKDIKFSDHWKMTCSSQEVNVVALPQFKVEESKFDVQKGITKTYTLKSFKIAIVRDLEVTSKTVPFSCK